MNIPISRDAAEQALKRILQRVDKDAYRFDATLDETQRSLRLIKDFAKEAMAALAQADQPAVPQPDPCPDTDYNLGCKNRHQCWEPCGELGKSEAHAKVYEPGHGGRPMTMREIMEAEEKPEPQAQAGEPEAVVWLLVEQDGPCEFSYVQSEPTEGYEPCITLQSHRETIATLRSQAVAYKNTIAELEVEAQETIAKKDAEAAELRASLLACERDAQRYRYLRATTAWQHGLDADLTQATPAGWDSIIDAAITQAQELLK